MNNNKNWKCYRGSGDYCDCRYCQPPKKRKRQRKIAKRRENKEFNQEINNYLADN